MCGQYVRPVCGVAIWRGVEFWRRAIVDDDFAGNFSARAYGIGGGVGSFVDDP